MSTTEAQDAPQAGASQMNAAPEPQAPQDAQKAPDGAQDGTTLEGLPEKAIEIIADLRKEAAKYRTANKELNERLNNAKSPEDFEKIKAESASQMRSLMAENVALAAGLPPALASRIVGNTREEMEADAKALLELLPKPPAGDPKRAIAPRGGLNPNVDTGTVELDPGKLAAAIPRS